MLANWIKVGKHERCKNQMQKGNNFLELKWWLWEQKDSSEFHKALQKFNLQNLEVDKLYETEKERMKNENLLGLAQTLKGCALQSHFHPLLWIVQQKGYPPSELDTTMCKSWVCCLPAVCDPKHIIYLSCPTSIAFPQGIQKYV